MIFETQVRRLVVVTVLLLAPIPIAAQQIDRDKIVAQLGKGGPWVTTNNWLLATDTDNSC